jgi:predicted permease
MMNDLRFGLRLMRRSPGVTGLAVLCLTLGIGATTAVFSWIEGVLLRPYPLVANADRVFVLSGTVPGATKGTAVSWPDFDDLRRSSTLAESFIAEKIVGTTLSVGGDRADRAAGSVVSANYFEALGIRPVLGRGFEPQEETGRNAHPVVVISHQLWRDRFGADPQVVGKTQMLNGVRHTIVGVAPEGFYGTFIGYGFQFWVPASMQELFDPGGYKLDDRSARFIEGFVRLKPGVSLAAAQAELSAAAMRLERQYPATNRARGIRLLPLWQSPFNAMEILFPALGLSLAVVASVLLIACANVANLLLLRGVDRRRELTIRLAIGAARGRLVRQLVTEGVLLSVLGTGAGLLTALWWRNGLALLFPARAGTPLRVSADLDWRVLGLSAAVSLAATLLFGLMPAVLTSRVDLAGALKSESSGIITGRGRAWLRTTLVVVQVSLSFLLLVGGGLVMRSLTQLRTSDPGFTTDTVMATGIDFTAAGYDTARATTLQDELLIRLSRGNGIQAASFVRVTPFSYRGYSSAPIAVDGYDTPIDERPIVDYDEVGPGYLATIGIPLVAGREFTQADDTRGALVAVVNETMAARYWRGADPIGQRVLVNGRSIRVVGLARDSKTRNLSERPAPFFYLPLRQTTLGQGLVIRTALTPQATTAALVRELHALDANLAPSEVITLREQIARTTASSSTAVTLLLVFAGVALALAAIGLYGVMSFSVSQSAREFGLRRALGCDATAIMRLVMSRGLAHAGAGMLVGAAASLQLTRLLGNLLYGVSPRDPVVFATAAAILGVTAIAACGGPAYRAMRTDPLLALRGD